MSLARVSRPRCRPGGVLHVDGRLGGLLARVAGVGGGPGGFWHPLESEAGPLGRLAMP